MPQSNSRLARNTTVSLSQQEVLDIVSSVKIPQGSGVVSNHAYIVQIYLKIMEKTPVLLDTSIIQTKEGWGDWLVRKLGSATYRLFLILGLTLVVGLLVIKAIRR